MEPNYGADISRRQFVLLVIALCSGTVIEWYDFTVYSQLSPVITQLFFPSTNPVVKQLAFWAVFAMGFVSRPFGAVLFGHIGDAVGRRITMLISVSCIVFPTVIIGCLPTYQQGGLVAPILMAVLRFTQGLAVGGEFGSAIVYLIEMAPQGSKGLVASLGVMSLGPGIILGTIAVLVVTYACSPGDLALWGWRIPFLLSVIIAPVAILLRRALPEPTEFLKSKQKLTELRVASIAVQRVASNLSRQLTAGSGQLSSRQYNVMTSLNGRRSLKWGSFSSTLKGSGRDMSLDVESPATAAAAAGVWQQQQQRQQQQQQYWRDDSGVERSSIQSSDALARVIAPAGAAADGFLPAVEQQQQQLLHIPAAAAAAVPAVSLVAYNQPLHFRTSLGTNSRFPAESNFITSPRLSLSTDSNLSPFLRSQLARLSFIHQQQQQQQQPEDAVVVLPPDLEHKVAAEIQQVQHVVKRHIPLVQLFRGYWQQLVLQVLFEAVYASSFFVFFSWLPSFLVSSKAVSAVESLWIILIGMVLFTATVPATGHFLVDRGLPKIWTYLLASIVIGAVVVPFMIGIGSHSVGAVWVLPPLMLGMNGVLSGLMTSIGPQLYEPGVRNSGYNLGHNVSFAIFGGLSPLMVSALAVGLQNRAYIAAGVIVDITAGLSIMAGLALALVSPHVNHTEKALAEAVAVPEAAAGAVNADVSVAGGDDAVRDQELSRV